MATATHTATPSATSAGPSTKHTLSIFIPIAIATSFLLLVVSVFLWWICSRVDQARQRTRAKGCQQGGTKEDVESQSGDELELPTYKAKDNALPPYEIPKDSVKEQNTDGESQSANGEIESAA